MFSLDHNDLQKMMMMAVPSYPIPTITNNPTAIPQLGMQFSALQFMLMNAQLQHMIEHSMTAVKKEEMEVEEKPIPFSISSLLQTQSSSHQDKQGRYQTFTNDENDDHLNEQPSISPSASSDVTVYTLDALETSDGRARTDKKSSASSSASTSSRCVCDQCGKSYATTSNLSRHKQTHRPLDSPHAKQCPHCDRVYVSMPALSMHILTHKASHECTTCGKTFSRLWLLQGHLRSHTGQRPFGCAHCGKSFADRSNLRAHILTHTGEKRYSCKQCGKRFALRSYLNRHQEAGVCRVEEESLPRDQKMEEREEGARTMTIQSLLDQTDDGTTMQQ